MKYNQIHYELAPQNHRIEDGETKHLVEYDLAYEMAHASKNERDKIVDRRKVRLGLIRALKPFDGYRRPETGDPQSIRKSIIEETREIERLRESANIIEGDAATEYEGRESTSEDRVA